MKKALYPFSITLTEAAGYGGQGKYYAEIRYRPDLNYPSMRQSTADFYTDCPKDFMLFLKERLQALTKVSKVELAEATNAALAIYAASKAVTERKNEMSPIIARVTAKPLELKF